MKKTMNTMWYGLEKVSSGREIKKREKLKIEIDTMWCGLRKVS